MSSLDRDSSLNQIISHYKQFHLRWGSILSLCCPCPGHHVDKRWHTGSPACSNLAGLERSHFLEPSQANQWGPGLLQGTHGDSDLHPPYPCDTHYVWSLNSIKHSTLMLRCYQWSADCHWLQNFKSCKFVLIARKPPAGVGSLINVLASWMCSIWRDRVSE